MPHPTLGDLPSLASPDDIIARLGRNLNQVEAARVDAMLKDGSAIIRRYARNTFTYVANDVITAVADAGIIVLPGKPIIAVNTVEAIAGNLMIQDFPVTWWIFDGVETLTIPSPGSSGVMNLAEYWYDYEWFTESYRVGYEHGYTDVPDDINGMLCSAIISELSTPTMSATIQSEAIGAYSYSMRRTVRNSTANAPMAGIYAALLDFGMADLLADYRKKQGTLALRF